MEYHPVRKSIDVPRGAGVDGFILAIEKILTKRNIKNINISANGKINYERMICEGEPEEDFEVDFTTVTPWAVLRNTNLVEVKLISDNAAVSIAQLFQEMARDLLNPIGFAISQSSTFRKWHTRTTSLVLDTDQLYGLPILYDPLIPQDVLVLCAGFGRQARLVDTKKAYKLTIPEAP